MTIADRCRAARLLLKARIAYHANTRKPRLARRPQHQAKK